MMRVSSRTMLVLALVVAVCVQGHEGGGEGHVHHHEVGEGTGEAPAGEGEAAAATPAPSEEAGAEEVRREPTIVEEGLAARMEAWNKCDRKRSREARAILNEELYPVVEQRGYELPSSCPLAKQSDMYLDNELHKREVRYANWKCTYCQKVFKSEHFLEQHFQNRHPYTVMRDAVCLGDYCELLECDLFRRSDDKKGAAPLEVGGRAGCNPKQMQRRRHRCQAMVDSCFPPHHSNLANELHHQFEALYCSHLTCAEVGSEMRSVLPPESMMASAARKGQGNKREAQRQSGWKKLWIVLGVLFGLMLVIFYLGVCLYRKDIRIVDDLRKLGNSKRKKRLELLKAKNY